MRDLDAPRMTPAELDTAIDEALQGIVSDDIGASDALSAALIEIASRAGGTRLDDLVSRARAIYAAESGS